MGSYSQLCSVTMLQFVRIGVAINGYPWLSHLLYGDAKFQ